MDWEFQENSKVHEIYKELGVKTVATSLTDKKGRTTHIVQTFGKDGRLESTTKVNHKGKQVSVYTQTFNVFGKLEKTELKSNKKSLVSHYEYNENQQLVYHEIQSNGKIDFYRIWKYNENGMLVENSSFNAKGLLSKVLHHFDDNYKRIKTEYFNKKNKLINAYNYNCSDEGEKVVVTEKEKLVCAFDARENDMLIRIEETTDARGRISRVVSKYREADTVLLERNFYDNRGKIYTRTTHHPIDELLKSRETFKNSGKPWYLTLYEYDDSWNIVRQENSFKGEKKLLIQWEYDEHGICKHQEHLNHKQRVMHKREVEVLDYH